MSEALSPKETLHLTGQAEAEAQLLQAFHSGRMPHAWLISGPQGIGKATLAYRFARFLLSGEGSGTLEVDMQTPAVRRVQSGSHADLMVLEIEDGTEIKVDAVREVNGFLAHTPAESKWRVVIVDCADAMNTQAANAILKTLEEPPERAILLLVSHNPGKLLPTIRSRCRMLKLKPLSIDDFSAILRERATDADMETQQAYFQLSEGSPGLALFLLEQEAMSLYFALLDLFSEGQTAPNWEKAHGLAGQLAGKANAQQFQALAHVLQYFFRRIIRASKLGAGDDTVDVIEGEGDLLAAIAGYKTTASWLQTWEEVAVMLQDVERIYLDRKQVVLNIISAIQPNMRFAA